jgi:hypothetical protein
MQGCLGDVYPNDDFAALRRALVFAFRAATPAMLAFLARATRSSLVRFAAEAFPPAGPPSLPPFAPCFRNHSSTSGGTLFFVIGIS